jgi:hypothetical protein
MAVAHNRCKFSTVSLPKRPRGGGFISETAERRFRSETATWIQKWFKISAGTSRKLYAQWFFKAETTGVVMGIFVKCPGGRT